MRHTCRREPGDSVQPAHEPACAHEQLPETTAAAPDFPALVGLHAGVASALRPVGCSDLNYCAAYPKRGLLLPS